jgi:hypothetical protein
VSNSPSNREQDQIIPQTPTQLNPGGASPNDFKIGGEGPLPGHGQCGENQREYKSLLAEADIDGRQSRGEPTPAPDQVPDRRLSD